MNNKPSAKDALENKKKLLKKLLNKKNIAVVDKAIPLRQEGARIPLSYSQERLWILDQLSEQDLGYNMSNTFSFDASLDVMAVQQAFNQLIERHHVLRTTFALEGNAPVQTILPELVLNISVVEITHDSEIQVQIANFTRQPFNLAQGPLLKAVIYKKPNGHYVIQVVIHHIIFDGWSIEVMQKDFFALYNNIIGVTDKALPLLPIQYADYSVWQKQKDMSKEKAYWHKTLAGYENNLQLPQDLFSANTRSQEVSFCARRYSHSFSTAFALFNQQHQCTVFMATFAAFALLASRYIHTNDICLGVTVSGREMPELEGLLGFFVNILPIRVNVTAEMTVAEYMRAVKQAVLGAFDHQSLPFEELLNEINFKRDESMSTLVPLMIRHANFINDKSPDSMPDVNSEVMDEVAFSDEPLQQAAKCDIDMVFSGSVEEGQELHLLLEYASDKFSRQRIEQLVDHHQNILQAMFGSPDTRLADISIHSQPALHDLLVTRNQTESALDLSTCLPQLFEQQVEANTDAVACYYGDESLTFAELNQRANQLAHYLKKQGVAPEKLVAVCMPRSIDLMVSLLAIFKAGGAYVPIDPNYPADYIRTILANADIDLMISTTAFSNIFNTENTHCVLLDTVENTLAKESTQNLPAVLTAEHLANVLYTSGSTGQPKGVMVTHQQFLNCFNNLWNEMPFSEGDVVAQKTTASFAVSVKELFAGLLRGYPVAIFSDAQVKDANAFIAHLAKWQITRLNIVPSQLQMLIDNYDVQFSQLSHLRYVITAGEPLNAKLLQKVTALCPNLSVYNNYGCTELNDVTYFNATHYAQDSVSDEGFVPIGRAIQNTKLYILDRNLQPVALGMSGELYVESIGLPRGYLHQAEMTAERFIVNPFSNEANRYLFNTGDVVRYCTDGTIEYLHRWDFQIKVRGFRIDVRQIEHVLGQFSGIKTPVVHSWQPVNTTDETSKLVAYYIPEEANKTIDSALLKSFLSKQLPSFMVPDFFVALTSLPFLPNGKLNRRGLPAPDITHNDTLDSAEPYTETELFLVDVFADILKVSPDSINRTANFFDLGGNSLAAMYLVKKIEEHLGIVVSLNDIFIHQHIKAIASVIDTYILNVLGVITSSVLTTSSKPTASVEGANTQHQSFKAVLFNLTLMQLNQLKAGITEYDVNLSTTLFDVNNAVEYDDDYSAAYFPVFNSQSLYFAIKDNISHEVIATLLEVNHKIDKQVLYRAVSMLIEEVDALRTYFKNVNGWHQVIADTTQHSDVVCYQDMSLIDEKDYLLACDAECVKQAKTLDVTQPFLFRVIAFNGGTKKDQIAFIFHHLIFDGLSPQIILPRIFELYEYCAGQINTLEPFSDMSAYHYFRWFSERLNKHGVRERLSHWLSHDKWLDKAAYLDKKLLVDANKADEKSAFKLKHFVVNTIEIHEDVTSNVLHALKEQHQLKNDEAIMLVILRALFEKHEAGFLPVWCVDSGRHNLDGLDTSNMIGYLSVHAIMGLNIQRDLPITEWFSTLKAQLDVAQVGINDFSAAYYNNFSSDILSDTEISKIKNIPYPNIYFNFQGVSDSDANTSRGISEPQDLENVYFSGMHFTSAIENNKLVITAFYTSDLYSEQCMQNIYQNIEKEFVLLAGE